MAIGGSLLQGFVSVRARECGGNPMEAAICEQCSRVTKLGRCAVEGVVAVYGIGRSGGILGGDSCSAIHSVTTESKHEF